MEGGGEEDAGDAHGLQPDEVGHIAHTAGREDPAVPRPGQKPGKPLPVRPRPAADLRKRHGDDAGRPKSRVRFERGRPEKALAPVVQRQDDAGIVAERGERRGVVDRFAAENHRRPGEAEEALRPGARPDAGVEPELGLAERCAERGNGRLVGRAAPDRVEIGEVEGAERAERPQASRDGGRVGRSGKPAFQRPVVRPVSHDPAHDEAAHEIENRDDLHGDASRFPAASACCLGPVPRRFGRSLPHRRGAIAPIGFRRRPLYTGRRDDLEDPFRRIRGRLAGRPGAAANGKARPMTRTLGWDVGGAHLKAVLAERGEIVKVWQEATPLWKGLEPLGASLGAILAAAGPVDRHAVTMTGELSDIFPDRREGVAALTGVLSERIGGAFELYAGEAGFVKPATIGENTGRIASANWHASARLTALRIEDALFLDMGSTTTDIVPVTKGAVCSRSRSDAGRLIAGELVYQGYTRTALMAVAGEVFFAGHATPTMAELFATMADVQRVLGILDEADDQHAAADNKEKTVEASRSRLARMIGRDASEASAAAFEGLAANFAEAQIRRLHDAALMVLSRGDLKDDAPVVVAGSGRPVLKRLAARLDRGVVDFTDLIDCRSDIRDAACRAAPAAALALLADGLL